MPTPLRIATLVLAAGFAGGLGLTAAPPRAADGTLGRDREVVGLSGAERWSLRPTKASAATTLMREPATKAIALSELPTQRRSVRVVYEGYAIADSVSPAR